MRVSTQSLRINLSPKFGILAVIRADQRLAFFHAAKDREVRAKGAQIGVDHDGALIVTHQSQAGVAACAKQNAELFLRKAQLPPIVIIKIASCSTSLGSALL